ncbi:UNVERIFIED_CONTAM: hypothetical protein Sangu_3108500 [Sesamum angustifolium]|uniref:Uncharacterized protein n=1 Tax=Sesamum angustifolium TaxID=2727405 RepID=A0AAW2K613_9LAMI
MLAWPRGDAKREKLPPPLRIEKEHVWARSSAESEYRSLAHTASELVWLRSLLTELSLFSRQPSTIWCDNVSAASLALAQALSS